MKFLPLSLMLVPLMCLNVYADERDYNISVTAQGTLPQGREYVAIGNGKIYSAETLLAPHGGYQALYERFEKENKDQISVGVWQKAQAFEAYLQRCNINVPVDSLLTRIGHDAIFASSNLDDINKIAEEVGQHLSFERKITFISQVGASLNGVYDFNDREKTPVVSMMDMVKARQNGTKAGVCRDMHLAMAQLLVKMGVPDSFVIATQVVGGGHAVLLVQDPNDVSKSYMVNYGNSSSQASADPSAHLLLNGSIPSIGVNYRIYSAEGKPLTTLPSGLGLLLNDFMGKDPSNLDPLVRSQNTFARVELASVRGGNNDFSVGLAAGESSDRDRVVALTAQYQINDEHFPMEVNTAIYNLRREGTGRGAITGNGAYVDGVQYVKYTPVKGAKLAGGKVDVEVIGRLGVRANFTIASEERGDKNAFSAGTDVYATAGTTATYTSNSGKTSVRTSVEALGALDKSDIRNETFQSTTFDLRNITGTVVASREITRRTSGYRVNAEAGGTVVVRPGLGIQSRQQVAITVVDDKGRVGALTVSREGQAAGRTLAFVPGSLETYSIEASASDRNRNRIGAGVFCSKLQEKKSCGTRATLTLKL